MHLPSSSALLFLSDASLLALLSFPNPVNSNHPIPAPFHAFFLSHSLFLHPSFSYFSSSSLPSPHPPFFPPSLSTRLLSAHVPLCFPPFFTLYCLFEPV